MFSVDSPRNSRVGFIFRAWRRTTAEKIDARCLSEVGLPQAGQENAVCFFTVPGVPYTNRKERKYETIRYYDYYDFVCYRGGGIGRYGSRSVDGNMEAES